MPFTRVSLLRGKSVEFKETVIESVYRSMRATLAVAENDRFLICIVDIPKENWSMGLGVASFA
ncbi:MAG: hypothetical protein JO264_10125 [Acidisphaera sp.]|nr:hypothetical protein [Acidisphaera sp.]